MRTKSKKTMIETHGKVEGEPTMLEQVWGFNESARFGTINEAEYKESIEKMNRPELEDHARRVGVVIVENTARLKSKLLDEFRNYVTYLRRPKAQAKQPVKISPEVAKILAEGR